MFLLFICSLSLASCATIAYVDVDSKHDCDFDPNTSYERLPPPPFVEEFVSSTGKIVFIGAEHGEEPKNTGTFNFIRNAFAKDRIRISIVEGLEHFRGISPKTYLQEYREGHYRLEEPVFLTQVSVQNGADFVGGEISDKELVKLMARIGFSQKDVAGCYILRTFENRMDSTINALIHDDRFPYSKEFLSEEEFRDWFMNITGRELPVERDPTLSRPFQGRKDRLQTLVNEITWARDRYLANVIRESFQTWGNAVVVYGAGHYLAQKCFIQKWWKD